MPAIISPKNAGDRDRVAGFLRTNNISWNESFPIEVLFLLDTVRHDDPVLLDLPVECHIDDGDTPIHAGAGEQELIIPKTTVTTDGNWALARIIRRNRPYFNRQAGFPIRTFFRSNLTGAGVDYYSLDAGFRVTHEQLAGRAMMMYDYYPGDPVINQHGTATAAASCGNTVGLARGATLLGYRCLDSTGSGTLLSITTAAGQLLTDYNARSNPGVVNISIVTGAGTWGVMTNSLISAGLVLVVPAGNDGADIASLDSGIIQDEPDVITAAGTTMMDSPYYRLPPPVNTDSTRYGARVDVCAPSQRCILASNTTDSSYYISSGTSFGCAYTSGVVACLLEGHSKLADRAAVQAVKAYIIAQATTGKLKNFPIISIQLPDRILYLNPDAVAPVTF